MVHAEIMSDSVKHSFLDAADDRVIDKLLDMVIPGVGEPMKKFFSRDDLRKKLNDAQDKVLQGTPQTLPVSPQKRRRGARRRLADRPKSVAARILQDLGLAPTGFDIGRLLPEVKGTNNLVAAIRLVHRGINEKLGISNKERNKPSANEAETTMEELDAIGDSIKKRIENKRK